MKTSHHCALGVATLLLLSACQCTSGTKQVTTPQETVSLKDPSMQKTDSGLLYVIEQECTGPQPRVGQKATVHYTGRLYNGEGKELGPIFDSSKRRNDPFVFTVGVGQVIKGWDEAVLDMKVGEKRSVVLAPDLAYGARGAGNVIPPNATLHFEIELLDVK